MKVAKFMSSPVCTVSSERSVQYASDMMNELRIGSLVVMDDEKPAGIITSRDVRSSHPNRIAADAMTPDPISIAPGQFAWDALETMKQHQIERLLVKHEDQVVGIVTRETLQIKLNQIIDPLTGLYRAPYIQQIGEHFLHHRQYFQLLFIDLNNFGEINKLYGHPAGDDILVEFSKRLRELTNEQDHVCRYGGDEFVVIACRNEHDAACLADALSQLTDIHNIQVSAAVGLANDTLIPEFFSLSFRDLISKASLFSTSMKSSPL